MATFAGERLHPSHGRVTTLRRAAATAAGAAALTMAIGAVIQDGPPEYGTGWHALGSALFLVYLLSSMAAVRLVHRSDGTPTVTSWLIPIGYALIVVGVVLELIARGPLSWFMVVAGPGLVASTVGFVVWAAWARRRTRPQWAWLLLGVGGVLAIFLSEFGTSVLIAAFWLLYASGRIELEPELSSD